MSKIGKLRNRLLFQSKTQSSDGAGGFTSTWSDITTIWGSVEPLSGFERVQAEREFNPQTHKIVIRYRNDINIADKLEFNGHTYNIRAADPAIIGKKRYLEIRVDKDVPSA